MLTKEASNAVLKTLEEPPAHAVFVLCTTEMRAMLPTIRSRCQRFAFARPGLPEISDRPAPHRPGRVDRYRAGRGHGDRPGRGGQLPRRGLGARPAGHRLPRGDHVADVRNLLGTTDAEVLFRTLDLVAAGDAAECLRLVDDAGRLRRRPEHAGERPARPSALALPAPAAGRAAGRRPPHRRRARAHRRAGRAGQPRRGAPAGRHAARRARAGARGRRPAPAARARARARCRPADRALGRGARTAALGARGAHRRGGLRPGRPASDRHASVASPPIAAAAPRAPHRRPPQHRRHRHRRPPTPLHRRLRRSRPPQPHRISNS